MGNLTGTPQYQVQPAKTGRTESGTYTDIPYESTDFDQIRLIAVSCDIAGILYDWEQTFGKQKITVHYPYNFVANSPATEPPVNLWELNSQKVQKSILDASNPLANNVKQAELYVIGLFQQNKSEYIIVPDNDTVPIVPPIGSIAYPETPFSPDGTIGARAPKRLPIAQGSVARTLLALINSGVESKDVFAPQLKFTQTVNSQYPIQAPNTNVGQIISTPTLYLIENIPNNVLFILPNDADPIPIDNTKPVLRYGWYKNAPSVNQIARQKFQLVFTWDYGLWPVDLYGEPL